MKKEVLVVLVVFAAAAVALAQPPLPNELLPQLRKGGYILFIRHPQTNPDQADTDPLHLDNVKAQRQLTGEVTASVDVTEGGLVVSPRENQRRAKALRELLSTPTAEGKNTIIVSHKPNLQDAAGKEFGDLAESEVVVFWPLGEGKFKTVAR